MINLPSQVRGLILDQLVTFKNGHLASAFSLVEILIALYSQVMHHRPDDPQWDGRDRLILSKGHGCSALYATLATYGYFPASILTSEQNGNILGGHPDRKKVPGVEFATGSLGHGLAVATGMALAAKKQKKSHRIYCIIGDGEMQEGSVWEAALLASHLQLNNLMVIVDYNRYQSSGAVQDIVSLEPIVDKWRAFGWQVSQVSGYNVESMARQFNFSSDGTCPRTRIAYTDKGQGVSFFQTDPRWHTQIPNADEVILAKKELGLIK